MHTLNVMYSSWRQSTQFKHRCPTHIFSGRKVLRMRFIMSVCWGGSWCICMGQSGILEVHRYSQIPNWIYMLSTSMLETQTFSLPKKKKKVMSPQIFWYWAKTKQNKNASSHPGDVLDLYQKWEYSLVFRVEPSWFGYYWPPYACTGRLEYSEPLCGVAQHFRV